ncbi:MAG: class I SAM-dependent methyltransferase [Pseudomonadota bacterium]|nr:class I SAM-dependent methyltransferase [Pseudomonadota bacterium]
MQQKNLRFPKKPTHPMRILIKIIAYLSLVLGGAVIGYSADQLNIQNKVDKDVYQYSSVNYDGIGKIYMGREISHVMGHQGASWLERPNRVNEERTDLLLANLPIKPGDRIADIGAGTGYFSLPMSNMVGDNGTVFAVDIQPEMLSIIQARTEDMGINNIKRLLAKVDNPNLPKNSINLVLFVDAYHELEWPREVMRNVYDSLITGGKVVLIEYRSEDPMVPIKKLHKMSEKQARKELEAIGMVFKQNLDILPQQHFLIFEKP